MRPKFNALIKLPLKGLGFRFGIQSVPQAMMELEDSVGPGFGGFGSVPTTLVAAAMEVCRGSRKI